MKKANRKDSGIVNDIDIKIIIVGDMATGKTSIMERYIDNKFDNNTQATIVPSFKPKKMKINGINYNINIWDLPGQDRNARVIGPFVRDTQGIVYCCEVKKQKTMENLKIWEESLKTKENIDTIPKILIENKCDLCGDESHYNEDLSSLKIMSEELGCLNFFRTSALNGYNIEQSINYLINEIINTIKTEDISQYDKILLKGNKNGDKARSCC